VLHLVDDRSRVGASIGTAQHRNVNLGARSTESQSAARFRALVDQHFSFVWRSVRRLGVPEADADDAVQEVFVVAARKLSHLEIGREKAFLFSTAVRVASTGRRTRRRHPEDPNDTLDARAVTDEPDASELLELREARALLQEILDQMGVDQRAVFVLAELEDLPVREIAALLGVPLGTVSSRLRAARDAFAQSVKRFAAREIFSRRPR
jgi:RNA polymerase sigma-70 factor (ECF subfamily)